jgi:hypothetical protein
MCDILPSMPATTPITINTQGSANPGKVNISLSGNNDNGVTGVTFAATQGDARTYNVSGLSSFLQNSDGTAVADPLPVSASTPSGTLVGKTGSASTTPYIYSVAPVSQYEDDGVGAPEIQVDP